MSLAAFYELPRNPIFAVGLPVGLGFATGLLTRNAQYGPRSNWYARLRKAEYNPPSWAFGVVWPLLYASMGWSSHLIVKALDRTPPGLGRDHVKLALTLYWVQLGLNQTWSFINFGLGQVGFALVDLLALTGTLGFLIKQTSDIDQTASMLLVPYIAWTSYASYLNGSLWWYNFGRQRFNSLRKSAEEKKRL